MLFAQGQPAIQVRSLRNPTDGFMPALSEAVTWGDYVMRVGQALPKAHQANTHRTPLRQFSGRQNPARRFRGEII